MESTYTTSTRLGGKGIKINRETILFPCCHWYDSMGPTHTTSRRLGGKNIKINRETILFPSWQC
jgi:hypothetical protein